MDPVKVEEGAPCAEVDEVESPPPFGASRSRSFPVYPQRHGPASPQLSSGSSHHKRKYIRGRYRGVRQRGAGRWAVELKDTVTGERRWLGTFSCPEEGALAFDKAAREIRGPRAKTNFPEGAYLASSDPPVVMSAKGVVLVGSPERPRAKQPVTDLSGTAAPGADRVDTGAIPRSQSVPQIRSGSNRPAGAPRASDRLMAAGESQGWGIAELPESGSAEADSDCDILEGGSSVKVEAAGEAKVKAEPEAEAEAEAEPVPLLSTSWRSSPWGPSGRGDGSASGPGGGFLAASSPSASTASASLPMGVQASEPAWAPRTGAPGALGFPSGAGPPLTRVPRATSSSSVASTPSPALHSGWAQPEDPSSAVQPEGAPAVHRGVQAGARTLQVGVGEAEGSGGTSGAHTGGRGGALVWTPSLQEELLARSLRAALDARGLWGLLTGPGFRPPGAPAPSARPPVDARFCPAPSPSRQEAHPSPSPGAGAGTQPALIQETLERLAQAAPAELLAALLHSPSATQSTAPVPPTWGQPQANGGAGHLPSLAAPLISVSAASSSAGGLEQQSTGAHTGTPMSSPASVWRGGRQLALGAPEAAPGDLPAGPRASASRETGAGNLDRCAEGMCPEEGELSLQEVERMLMDD